MLNYWNLYLACKQQQLYAGPLIIGTFEKRAPGAKKTLRQMFFCLVAKAILVKIKNHV